jgi:excisionase family DNA binding protein
MYLGDYSQDGGLLLAEAATEYRATVKHGSFSNPKEYATDSPEIEYLKARIEELTCDLATLREKTERERQADTEREMQKLGRGNGNKIFQKISEIADLLARQPKPVMTATEAANYMTISTRKIWELKRKREISACHIDGRIVFRRESLDRYLILKEGESIINPLGRRM